MLDAGVNLGSALWCLTLKKLLSVINVIEF